MGGIIVPRDRTTHQRASGFCRNPKCVPKGRGEFNFVVEDDLFSCPKCGANASPMVGLNTLIHFLLPTPKGKILGAGGLRYNLACDVERAYLATVTNDEAATGDIECVNCPGCLDAADKVGIRPVPPWRFRGKS